MSFKSAFSCSNTTAIQLQLLKHQRILTIIHAASPRQLQTHIKDCVINGNSLIIYLSSAVWASQLRFCTTQIQQAVNAQSNERINKIRLRVLTPEPFIQQEEVKKIIPTSANIELLRDNAETLSEGKLKSALLRLSQVLQKQTQ